MLTQEIAKHSHIRRISKQVLTIVSNNKLQLPIIGKYSMHKLTIINSAYFQNNSSTKIARNGYT